MSTAPLLPAPGRILAGSLAETALRDASTDALLRAYAALTHQIHAAEDEAGDYIAGPVQDECRARAADLREQRGLIHAEVLRRTGDA